LGGVQGRREGAEEQGDQNVLSEEPHGYLQSATKMLNS
jgi:hypothetical protein